MHKEEFSNTLLKDEFISYLILQIKEVSNQIKIEKIINLISELEKDSFLNNKNLNIENKLSFENISTNSKENVQSDGEMNRFSSFLNNQLGEIIDRQKALELQLQNIKANNNVNNLNNINNLINLKNTSENFYLKGYKNSITKNSSVIIEKEQINKNNFDHYNDLNCKHFTNGAKNPICNNNDYKNHNENITKNYENINKIDSDIRNFGYNNIFAEKNKINTQDAFNDIDELVAYININIDKKQNKKNKKKAKNNKKKIQDKISNSQINLKTQQNNTVIDENFIENFKNNIYRDSCNAENIRKIKPILSIEWINRIKI